MWDKGGVLWNLFRYGFGLIFVVIGITHLVRPGPFLEIMPTWVPYHRAAVLISGLAEIGLGIGLWFPASQKYAAWGLIALLIAVFPANIYMAQNPHDFHKIPLWLLYARLPVQGILVAIAWAFAR